MTPTNQETEDAVDQTYASPNNTSSSSSRPGRTLQSQTLRLVTVQISRAVSQCHISVTNRTKINIKSRTALSRVHTAAKAAYVAKLSVLPVISRWTWVSQYRNVSILDFIGAKGDGDGEW